VTQADLPPSLAGVRRRQRIFVIFTAILCLAYARQLLTSPTAGQDFRAFFAAATVSAQHADPYDWTVLGRTEDRLYNAPLHARPGDPRYNDFLPFPEGPWLALGLQPFSGLPWQVVYPFFAGVMLLAIAAGAWLVMLRLGWPPTRRRVALALTILSPIAFINVFQGQVSALVFLGFAGAWYLAGRGHPMWGGLVLTLVWVKPNLGVALPLVLVLLEPASRWRLLLGFGSGSLVAFGLAALALPGVLGHWLNELLSHWRAAQGIQPDVASIHSFYYPALSGPLKTAALIIVMVAGAGYTVWAIRRAPDARRRGLTLLLLWFALLPYVHSFDAILLLPVVLVLLGPDLRGWADPLTEVAIWAFAILPFGYFVGLRFGFFNGFTAVPVLLLLIAWHRRVVRQQPQVATQAVAA
jgi:Glycosyltransferase family 87